MARFFARDSRQRFGRPVAVEIQGLWMIGFVMQEEARLPVGPPLGDAELIAVYLPMSYQIGGYTLYLDPERVKPLDIGMEQTLRAVLTGGSLVGGTDRSR